MRNRASPCKEHAPGAKPHALATYPRMAASRHPSRLTRLARPLARLAVWFLIGILLFPRDRRDRRPAGPGCNRAPTCVGDERCRHPSFSPAPARAEIEGEDTNSLPLDERDAIERVAERFLRAYLSGDAAALDYLAPPGARPGASSLRLRLEDLVSVDQVGEGSPTAMIVLATVRAHAPRGPIYTFRYRLSLVRSDRWYVEAVNAPTEPAPTVRP